MDRTAIIFGAGATAACFENVAGPLTNDLLPLAFGTGDRTPLLDAFRRYDPAAQTTQQQTIAAQLLAAESLLVSAFDVPHQTERRKPWDYPPLPLLLSLLDLAIGRNEPFGRDWYPSKLRQARRGLECAIYKVLESQLCEITSNVYTRVLEKVYGSCNDEPTILSLNYDTLVDNALVHFNRSKGRAERADYGCQPIPMHATAGRSGKLYKLHGSLDWAYCPVCGNLWTFATDLGRRENPELLSLDIVPEARGAQQLYGEKRPRCPAPGCNQKMRSMLIAPTHFKDYRNPHINRVWFDAETNLREITRLIFAGYSLPESDVEVIYLLKRACSQDRLNEIHVIEYHPDPNRRSPDSHPSYPRYEALFGQRIRWWGNGLAQWCG